MTSLDGLDDALVEAETLLAPLSSRATTETSGSRSLLRQLSQASGEAEVDESIIRRRLVRKALSLLRHIHATSKDDQNGPTSSVPPKDRRGALLYQPKTVRIVSSLLDFLSLEGIYPLLSLGVGVPIEHRVKPLLQAGVTARRPESLQTATTNEEDVSLLKDVALELSAIISSQDAGKGLQSLIEDRLLTDVVSACAELAYGPKTSDEQGRSQFHLLLSQLIEISSTSRAFQVLTSILHPAAPSWLRSYLSKILSLLPLRPNGVRQTLEFIVFATPSTRSSPHVEDEVSTPDNATLPPGPGLPLESLQRASRLLSSVPSSLTPWDYYWGISPQLLDLLDRKASSDLASAAALIVGRIILTTKGVSGPQHAGWDVFAKPLLNSLNPSRKETDLEFISPCDHVSPQITLVSEDEFETGWMRASTLVSSHPNPALSRRLLKPLLLPLWALWCFAGEFHQPPWQDQALSLIQAYLRVSPEVEELLRIAENLDFDGPLSTTDQLGWSYALGDKRRLKIQARHKKLASKDNLIGRLQRIELRVDLFNHLLTSLKLDDQRIEFIFLSITRRWLLLDYGSHHRSNLTDDNTDGTDSFKLLVLLKIIQSMIQHWQDQLASKPKQILELAEHLLEGYIELVKAQQNLEKASDSPSYEGLRYIVQTNISDKGARPKAATQEETETAYSQAEEIASLALGLISSALSSPRFQPSDEDTKILSSLEPLLLFLAQDQKIPFSIAHTSSHVIQLLSSVSAIDIEGMKSTARISFDEDRKTYALSLSYLSETIIPVRAQGLAILTKLVADASPVIDVLTTANLLISLLQASDDFIYLNAIKALTVLASNYSRTVAKVLVEGYTDPSKDNSLDYRLRLGEALLRVVQMLGGAFVGETASMVIHACLAIAGRRGNRLQTVDTVSREDKVEDLEKSGYETWANNDDKTDHEIEAIAKIVWAWENSSGEDIRIRTSALSIFGAAVETNVAAVVSSLSFTGFNLALDIISMEMGEGSGILRRAAVSVIASMLKALHEANDAGRQLGFTFTEKHIDDAIRVLQYAQSTDSDGLVKENAAAVVDDLKAWKLRITIGTMLTEPSELVSKFKVDDLSIAGLALNPERSSSGRPRIEEIDE